MNYSVEKKDYKLKMKEGTQLSYCYLVVIRGVKCWVGNRRAGRHPHHHFLLQYNK